ncbi:Rap1a/Tai family immunity protein [Altererythrobacter fulvus]|uniref:Rap1a/Tai family immunity protein n=1 Tax=Caenibius fulvus TaxID=2126012 RepID=UPI0030175D04
MAGALAASPGHAQSDTPTPSSGVFKTGEDIFTQCSSDDDATLEQCYGFLMGVYDTVTYMQDIGIINPSICPVGNAVIGDLRDKVVAYLASHDRNFSAVSMVINALTEAYPCSAAGQS